MTNANRPPELQAIIDLLQRGEPFASIEEAQRAVDAQMRGYNSPLLEYVRDEGPSAKSNMSPGMAMLHVMRNNPDPNKITLTRALELLGSKLPDGWLVVRSPHEPRGAESFPMPCSKCTAQMAACPRSLSRQGTR